MENRRDYREENVARLLRGGYGTEARPDVLSRERLLAKMTAQLQRSNATSGLERSIEMSGCPDLETLRAYNADELSPERRSAVAAHLTTCHDCSSVVRGLEKEDARSGLRTESGLRSRLRAALMGTPRRLAFAGMAAVVVLAGLVALPPVRSAADDFLGVFRAQKVAVVKVDQSMFRNLPPPSELGTMSGTEPKLTKVASLAEATRAAGFAVRSPGKLPAGLAGPTEIAVSSRTRMTYTFDEAKLKAYLASLGIASVKLPPPDQLKVAVNVPEGVLLSYSGSAGRLELAQGQSPTLELPAGMDVAGLREQLLAVLPSDLAGQLRSIPDWTTTAVLPAPKSADVRTLQVDGASATLVGESGDLALVWQKNGVFYALHGNLPESTMLEVANSLVGN